MRKNRYIKLYRTCYNTSYTEKNVYKFICDQTESILVLLHCIHITYNIETLVAVPMLVKAFVLLFLLSVFLRVRDLAFVLIILPGNDEFISHQKCFSMQ